MHFPLVIYICTIEVKMAGAGKSAANQETEGSADGEYR
jgi:hypothetical protein